MRFTSSGTLYGNTGEKDMASSFPEGYLKDELNTSYMVVAISNTFFAIIVMFYAQSM